VRTKSLIEAPSIDSNDASTLGSPLYPLASAKMVMKTVLGVPRHISLMHSDNQQFQTRANLRVTEPRILQLALPFLESKGKVL
jgi:hypothetical protein